MSKIVTEVVAANQAYARLLEPPPSMERSGRIPITMVATRPVISSSGKR
jgi:hypothetical protein